MQSIGAITSVRYYSDMEKWQSNYAFIDSQNVNLAIRAQGWKLDWKRFRIYLRDKYGVSKAYLFIGYVEENNSLYTTLQDAGFLCVFKPTLIHKDGTTKGNCDAELVLQAMIEYARFEKAIIVTGDGDFYCLVRYFIEQKKLEAVLIPNRLRFSALLKFNTVKPFLRFMNDLEYKLSYKKKNPRKDKTLRG